MGVNLVDLYDKTWGYDLDLVTGIRTRLGVGV